MPDYEVLIDGKPHKIELTRTNPTSFTAKLDDKIHKIDLQNSKLSSNQALTIKIDDKTYTIELPKIEQEKPLEIKVEETAFKVEVKTSSRRLTLTSFEPSASGPARRVATSRQVLVEGTVTAPMTGKVVSVKVRKGDQVETNQVLCVIEAMKMENEITAPRAGTVQEVNVSDGSSVSEGEALLVIG